jgi:hypothetical protein
MCKKLESLSPEPYAEDGRRVNCALVLDESALSVDARLLTPGNLERIKLLHMKPSEYYAWINAAEQKYNSMEASVMVREAVFKSVMDFRFTPPPFMYQWRLFAKNSLTNLNGSVPLSDWSCILLNSNALDYARKSFSLDTLTEIRRCQVKGSMKFEFMNSLERSMFKCPFPKKFKVRIYTCEPLHSFEKQLEKGFKDKPMDHFMASLGYLRVKTSEGIIKKWSEEQFNLRIRKSGGFIYSDFIEECFSGFALESAKQIVSANPPDCCVCCSNPVNVLLDTCGHSYCLVCLSTMLDSVTGAVVESCPTCRSSFTKDSLVQFRAYKTTRRKSKENSDLTRRRALGILLKRPQPLEDSETSADDMVMEEVKFYEDRTPSVETLLLVQYEDAIDKLRQWFPDTPCTSLENLSLGTTNQVSRIILVYPFMNVQDLTTLHVLLQQYTSREFSLEILCLGFGSSCTNEDYGWTSSLGEAYGAHEQTISSLIL